MGVDVIYSVRGVQALFALLSLSLVAYVSSWWSSHWRQSLPTELQFLLFAPLWSIIMLVPLVLVPLRFSSILRNAIARAGLLVVEGLTMMFWLGGFIALAVFLSDRVCFGTVCNVAVASAMVGSLNWVAWVVTLAWGVVQGIRKRKEKPAPMIRNVEMQESV